jgi:hypothetical protein
MTMQIVLTAFINSSYLILNGAGSKRFELYLCAKLEHVIMRVEVDPAKNLRRNVEDFWRCEPRQSDVEPATAVVDLYREQVRDYLAATGGKEGLLVFVTSGRVERLAPR